MQYFISFLEGIITFISPCLLPMLPIYISYFAGGKERTTFKTVKNALGFIAGFTLVFIAMGALAATLGGFLSRYKTAVNFVTGLIVIFFGLNFLGVVKVCLFKGSVRNDRAESFGFFPSMLLGIIFSLGWTPCVGTFLGSALLLASQQEQAMAGIIMLFLYSLGLGVPFLISAILIDRLKNTFDFIKKHYAIINTACGCFLILVGILMMTGILGRFLTILS